MQAARGTPLSQRGDSTSAPARPRRTQARLLFVLVAALAYTTDQVTKNLAVARLGDGRRVDLLGDLLGLRLTFNPGAAFSLGTGSTELLSVVAIVATAVVLVLAVRLGNLLWAFAFGLLLAGITGNLTDRLVRPPGVLRGEVVDFLQLPHWPIFNVADMCLNVAMVLVVVQSFRGVRLDGRPAETPS